MTSSPNQAFRPTPSKEPDQRQRERLHRFAGAALGAIALALAIVSAPSSKIWRSQSAPRPVRLLAIALHSGSTEASALDVLTGALRSDDAAVSAAALRALRSLNAVEALTARTGDPAASDEQRADAALALRLLHVHAPLAHAGRRAATP